MAELGSCLKIVAAVCHFLAFAGWCVYIAGYIVDLGGYATIVDDPSSYATGLGNDALESLTDPTSDAFVSYLFIISGFAALVGKLFHACCSKFKMLGMISVILLCASIAVGGFVAGPKGKSYVYCMTRNDSAVQGGTTCIKGVNDNAILLEFVGSGAYLLGAAIIAALMYYIAMGKNPDHSNKVVPAKASEVWV